MGHLLSLWATYSSVSHMKRAVTPGEGGLGGSVCVIDTDVCPPLMEMVLVCTFWVFYSQNSACLPVAPELRGSFGATPAVGKEASVSPTLHPSHRVMELAHLCCKSMN